MKKLLPEVCTIQYGFPFDSAKFSDSNGMPLIRIRDVVRGYSETYTTEEYKSEHIVHENDLLIGMDGEFNIAKWGKTPALLNQRVCRLAPKDSIDKDYLFYFMPVALKRIEEKTPFVTVKHLSAKELNKIEIPVLSLEEQRKIAETLSKVDELIAFREQQLAKLDELVKARFVEMFENVTEENALENLCHFIDYRGKTPEKSDSGLPFITAKNIRMHYMSFDTQEFISKKNYDKVMTRGIPKVGDVVFTTEAPLGNVCRIPQFDTDFYIGQRIITMQTKLLNPVYLEYALSSDDFKRKLVGKSSGSTVTGIRSKLLGKLTIPVPSKGLQNQFAAFVERVDQQKQTVQQSLEKLELMKKALMQEYFG